MPPIDHIVEKLLELRQDGSVLDLGAGDGRHALALARRGFDVTAVDNDPYVIEKLKKVADVEKLSIKAVQADMTDYFPENYDGILFIAAGTHLASWQIEELVQKMKNYTLPGGFHAIYTEMPHMEDEARRGYAKVLPWRSWYKDWELLIFEQLTDEHETKISSSDIWLKNTMIRLLARKPHNENRN